MVKNTSKKVMLLFEWNALEWTNFDKLVVEYEKGMNSPSFLLLRLDLCKNAFRKREFFRTCTYYEEMGSQDILVQLEGGNKTWWPASIVGTAPGGKVEVWITNDIEKKTASCNQIRMVILALFFLSQSFHLGVKFRI